MKMNIKHFGISFLNELQQAIEILEAAWLSPVAARDQMEILFAPVESHPHAPGARPGLVNMKLAHGVFPNGQGEFRTVQRIVRIQGCRHSSCSPPRKRP